MNKNRSSLIAVLIVFFIVINFFFIGAIYMLPDTALLFGGADVSVSPTDRPSYSTDSAVSSGDSVSSGDAASSDDEQSVISEADVPDAPDAFSYGIYNVGDTFLFGAFEQDHDTANGVEPIEWLVIDKNDEAIFVVSKYALVPCQYHKDAPDHYATWETCIYRTYLNGDFYNTTFTDEDRAYIALTHNINDDNVDFGTEGGNDTHDYVFFLSYDEVYRYFPEKDDRRCHATPYALAKGAYTNGSTSTFWWLRSPGKYRCNAQYVFNNGMVYTYGSDVGHRDVCARPAMWLNFLPE